MKTDHLDDKEMKRMMKLIKMFPLYIESDYFKPTEIRDLMTNITNFVLLSGEDKLKENFVAKIKMLF